jgi:hypothetical protein
MTLSLVRGAQHVPNPAIAMKVRIPSSDLDSPPPIAGTDGERLWAVPAHDLRRGRGGSSRVGAVAGDRGSALQFPC